MNNTIPNTDELLAKITQMVVDASGVAAGEVKPDSRFLDLGMDSLDALSMIGDLEDEYGIKIPNAEVLQIKTVGEAVAALQKRLV